MGILPKLEGMKISWPDHRSAGLCFGIACAFVVGLALRCYLLSDQIFADDEWHGFYFALGKSPGWLLTHFSIPGATCIPLNFYIWVLGQTTGWSETLLRLPSLLSGLLLLLCPCGPAPVRIRCEGVPHIG